MEYEKRNKLENGTKITIGSVTIEDATSIGIPGDGVELIEITTLGSTRKEWTPSDIPDSDEITITAPWPDAAPTISAAGDQPVACTITPKNASAISFSAFVTKVQPAAAEVDSKLTCEITLKPTEFT